MDLHEGVDEQAYERIAARLRVAARAKFDALAGGEPIRWPDDERILTDEELRFAMIDPDYEEQFHQYAGGGYHTHVMVEGSFCRACDERLPDMTVRLPFGNEVTRTFPFRATHTLVQGGGTHACGGKLAFEIARGPEGGPIEIIG